MEDTYQAIPNLEGHSNWSYYGVYDGHGGARCSVYVAHYLHKHVLAWIDAYIAHYSSNSTRLIAQLGQSLSTNNGSSNSNSTPSTTSSSNAATANATNHGTTSAVPSNLNQTIIAPNPNGTEGAEQNTVTTAGNQSQSGKSSSGSSVQQTDNGLIRQHDANSIPQCIVRIMNEILLKVFDPLIYVDFECVLSICFDGTLWFKMPLEMGLDFDFEHVSW